MSRQAATSFPDSDSERVPIPSGLYESSPYEATQALDPLGAQNPCKVIRVVALHATRCPLPISPLRSVVQCDYKRSQVT